MLQRHRRIDGIAFVTLLVAATMLPQPGVCRAAEKQKIESPAAAYSFGEEGTAYEEYQPEALAFAKGNLWVLGKAKNMVYQYDTENRKILKSYALPCKDPRGLSWDGTGLLVSDEKTHEVYRINPDDGSSAKMVDLNACAASGKFPVLPKDLKDLTAIAWDGKCLWVSFAAGYASSLFRVDPQKASIEQHIWAQGPRPEGLQWDGTHLVCIDARNNEIRRLDREGKPVQVVELPTKSPRGLTYDGAQYWYFDRDTNRILRIAMPK
ncbi:MAG: hypothetical protein JXP34_00655 [Planctomycetes bacterium]|nr:hypothetical protein [Planctomycetota bacterium]